MPEDWAVNMLLNLEDINHESALTVCWREQLVKIFDKKGFVNLISLPPDFCLLRAFHETDCEIPAKKTQT